MYGEQPKISRTAHVADAKERPAIEGYMIELERNLEWLHENINVLESRLASVTRPQPVQETCAKEPYGFGSPLAATLNRLNRVTYDMAVQINNIKDSLEV